MVLDTQKQKGSREMTQTIEQLRARIAELEEENARLKAECDDIKQVQFPRKLEAIAVGWKKQLAAAQEEWNQCSGLLDDAHRSIEMLEDQLATAEQRVAEACAELQFERSVNRHGYDKYEDAYAIRSGEWRKFLKEGE